MEPPIGRGLVFPRMQVSSAQLSRKHFFDSEDRKITLEYAPYSEIDTEQESFTFRKSVYGSRNVSGNNSSIRKLSFHTDDDSSQDKSEIDDSIMNELQASTKSFADSLFAVTPEMDRFLSKWVDHITSK